MAEQYWTTQDGRKIAVGDMSVDHLRNVLRMLLESGIIQTDEDREVGGRSYDDLTYQDMTYSGHLSATFDDDNRWK